jgi:hypothetical protein
VSVSGIAINGTDAGNYSVNTTASTTADITPLAPNVNSSILVLNPTLSGALSLSGNASIHVSGSVMVDSNSPTALSASGNAAITASSIKVVGKVGASGNASFGSAPITGVVSVTDPLLILPDPDICTSPGSVNLTNGSLTINPGVYSSIKVAGNGSLILNPGVYVLAGGDFSVSGNGNVSGTGVTIYNGGANSNPGHTFGGISLSGNGIFRITAPTAGTYANVLIFQARDNTRALSLSGNAMQGITGIIYAPAALLTMSGNSQESLQLIVNQLKLSGNGTSNLAADGSAATGEDSSLAGQLLSSDLWIYVDNTNGLLSADDLARLQDAIDGLNTLLAPYDVTINQVDRADMALANLVIDIGTTSANGGVADGVLGSETSSPGSSEITLIQGWNWYAGANPSAIGSGQYDFQTIVTHEIGHALGLGHNTNPASTMYATLATGTARRVLTTADLSIPDSDGGQPDALHADIPVSQQVARQELISETLQFAKSQFPDMGARDQGAVATGSQPFSVATEAAFVPQGLTLSTNFVSFLVGTSPTIHGSNDAMQVEGKATDRPKSGLADANGGLPRGGLALEHAKQIRAADAVFASMDDLPLLSQPAVDGAFQQLDEGWDSMSLESDGQCQSIDC